MFKLVIASLLVAATLAGVPKSDFEFLSDEEIHYINNVAKSTWKAGHNFHPEDHAYVKSMLGAPHGMKSEDPARRLPRKQFSDSISVENLPENFDARERWPHCPSIKEIKDTGNCGTSWAVHAASAITDRICIASQGKINFQVSAEDLWECCDDCGTECVGGTPRYAWEYFEHTGVVSGGPYNSSQGCKPYEIQPCEHHGMSGKRPPCKNMKEPFPRCKEHCRKGYPKSYDNDRRYGIDSYYLGGEEIIKELVTLGPVQTEMAIYQDFLHYKSGIYQHLAGREVGFISFKIIGYGVENGEKYWLVANSWNTDWGDKGFFKILRGQDECHIENWACAGRVKV